MSLVAIAAIVASVTVARQRTEARRTDEPTIAPERVPAIVNLDDIRAAGF